MESTKRDPKVQSEDVGFDYWRVSMTHDGLAAWKPQTFKELVLFRTLRMMSCTATFVAIFGTDLLVILFPDKIDEFATEMLLMVLFIYLTLECLGLSIFVRRYFCSWFFALDCMCISAVFIELISSAMTADHYSYWRFLHIQSFHHIPLLRSGRVARFGVRIGRLSALRANKVFIFGRQSSDSLSQGIANQFGRRGYDDERNLYPYIKEKFIDAFREQEKDGFVSRDDFTMMVRNLLHLDLEPEEEEVMYRLVTVFGRSQEIKFMEDQISNSEHSPKSVRKHWASLRTNTTNDPTAPVNIFKKTRRRSMIGKVFNSGNSIETIELDEVPKRRHSTQQAEAIKSLLVSHDSVDDSGLLQDVETGGRPDINRSISKRRSSMSDHQLSPTALSFNPFNIHRKVVPVASGGEVSSQSDSANPQGPSAKTLTQSASIFSRPIHTIDSGWKNIQISSTTKASGGGRPKIARVASMTNMFQRRTVSSEVHHDSYVEDSLDGPSFERQAELDKNAEMIHEMKDFEQNNPITAMRLKMTTAVTPIEIDTLAWGLQMFRKVEEHAPAAVPEHGHAIVPMNQRSDVRFRISAQEFETRMEEVLIIDGGHIFDSLKTFQARQLYNYYAGKKMNKVESVRGGSGFSGLFRGNTDQLLDPDGSGDVSNGNSWKPSNFLRRSSSKSLNKLPSNQKLAASLDAVPQRNSLRTSARSISAPVCDPMPQDQQQTELDGPANRNTNDQVHVSPTIRESADFVVPFDSGTPESTNKSFEAKKGIEMVGATNDRSIGSALHGRILSKEEVDATIPKRNSFDASTVSTGRPDKEDFLTSGSQGDDEKANTSSLAEERDSYSPGFPPPPSSSNSSASVSPSVSPVSPTRVTAAVEISDQKRSIFFSKKKSSSSRSSSSNSFVTLSSPFSSQRSTNKKSMSSKLSSRFFMSTPINTSTGSGDTGGNSYTAPPPMISRHVTSAQKTQLSEEWVVKVISKVKTQMKQNLKKDVEKDLQFGSGNNIADHVGRSSIRVALFGVFITLLVAPQLNSPVHTHCDDVNGGTVFRILQNQVRNLPNLSYNEEGQIMPVSCKSVRSDPDISRTVDEYLKFDPSPFLLRIDGCTLYTDMRYKYVDHHQLDEQSQYYYPFTPSQSDNSIHLRVYEMSFIPCHDDWDHDHRTDHLTKQDTVVVFDMRHIKQLDAIYSLTLSLAVLATLAVMSILLGRDTASITEVIVSPLTQLARDMDRVSRFDLSNKKKGESFKSVHIVSNTARKMMRSIDADAFEHHESSILEVRSIQQSFATMKTTIQSFAKYVPQDVVYQLVRAKAGMAKLDVKEREVTVLFSDIENFTKICESLGVGDKLLGLMSDYFTGMAEIISSTGGCLLEFIGDAVLAVWNAPTPEEMHAVLAVTAALEMHAYLESMAEEWDKKGYPRVRIRCGIHTAKVLVGNIGAPNRMKYGLLGDGVNTASRLEETNKRYATRTLISEATFKKVNRQINGVVNTLKTGNTPMAASSSPYAPSNLPSFSPVFPSPSHSPSQQLSSSRLPSVDNNGTSLTGHTNEKTFFQSRPVDRVVFKGKTIATTLYEVVDFTVDRKKEKKSPTTPERVSFSDSPTGSAGSSLSSINEHDASIIKDRFRSLSENAVTLVHKVERVLLDASPPSASFDSVVPRVNNLEQLKELMLEVHNLGWSLYLKRHFAKARDLFALVDEIQREIGPRTVVTKLPFDFGDGSEGDKAAMLLRDRCIALLNNPPRPSWDGADVLNEKHF